MLGTGVKTELVSFDEKEETLGQNYSSNMQPALSLLSVPEEVHPLLSIANPSIQVPPPSHLPAAARAQTFIFSGWDHWQGLTALSILLHTVSQGTFLNKM